MRYSRLLSMDASFPPFQWILPLLGALLLGAAPAKALEIDPGLRNPAAKSAVESQDLMILLQSRPDPAALENRVAHSSFPDRRAQVTATLRGHAASTQAPLLKNLEAAVQRGEARDVQSMWLINAVFVRGGSALLDSLAHDPTPGWVSTNPYLEMIEKAAADPAPAKPPLLEVEATSGSQKTDTVVWSLEWINAPAVWAEGYDGTGVLIGHLDSGAWLEQPDLVNRLWVNEGEIPGNGIDDDGNGYIDDIHGWDFGDQDDDPNDDNYGYLGGGHGTHTAGTVVGDGSGGTHTGVAPGAKIIVCKVTWNESGQASFEAILEAQQYAIDMGARLLTMSMGAAGTFPAAVLQAERYIGDSLRLLGVPFVVAAGNSHGQLPTLAELSLEARVPSPWNEHYAVPYSSRSGIIAVGASAYQSDTIWDGSSQGPADWANILPWDDWRYEDGNALIKPDVCAPGQGISSLIRPSGYSQPNWTGTSMACPHVSGVVALMLQKNPSLMPEDIDRILEQSAVDLGDPGKDNVFGAGRIDALAAVDAVPASTHPSLVIQGAEIVDANGNGSIEPGEDFDLRLDILNNSFTTDATTLTVFIYVIEDPLVEVTRSTAILPGIPHGSSISNEDGSLSLHASELAEQGHDFKVMVGLMAQDGYRTSADLRFFVGLPELRTHSTEDFHLTVTDRGTLGWWDMDQLVGEGAGAPGTNLLFAGGFWGGNGKAYVCNRDYVPTDPTEWELVTSPNGRLALAQPQLADEHYVGIFDDAGHPSPRGIQVTQYSQSWSDSSATKFVILRYNILNTSDQTISNYRAGIFCDWDFYYPFFTRAATDSVRNLVYTNDFYITGEHAGVRVLTPMGDPVLAVIDNPTYVHPNLQILDDVKWSIMNHLLDGVVGDTDDDYSNLAATGPFDLPPGEMKQVAFAVVYGKSLEDLQSSADLAYQRFTQTPTAVADQPPRTKRFMLGQNSPNPFNPMTTIHFQLARPGRVRLSVLDTKGRLVRVLAEGVLDDGPHLFRWDGRDEQSRRVSSGVYFYRLEADGRVATRKMVMVK